MTADFEKEVKRVQDLKREFSRVAEKARKTLEDEIGRVEKELENQRKQLEERCDHKYSDGTNALSGFAESLICGVCKGSWFD